MISDIPGVGQIIASDSGNFFMFVILCGGFNVAWIIGFSKVLRLLRNSMRLRIIAALAITVLVASAQVVMPSIDRDALERSRPRDVPKNAVHVGGAVGLWEQCTYDPTRNVDTCRIWYRGGEIKESGEFVPYDGGSPARADELEIIDSQNEPDRIGLRNGRILIPEVRTK